MRNVRWLAVLLLLAMTLSCVPAQAISPDGFTGDTSDDWLIPRLRDYPSFTDTAGSIAETAAKTCCDAGLMDGVDGRHFYPSNALTHAQIVVISARLHRLLTGGDLEYFMPVSLTGADWWMPYDAYLTEQISTLRGEAWYTELKTSPTSPCGRERFFTLLAAVLADTGAALPEINTVRAVPDCKDETLLQFYRWGVLNGKDAYGSLQGRALLTRGAAAALLSRLIDPQARLTFTPAPYELCRILLDIAPEPVLFTAGGQEITAEQFLPTLAENFERYRGHFAGLSLSFSGSTEQAEAVKEIQRLLLAQTLAEELHLTLAPSLAAAPEGYHGLTAAGQAWTEEHTRALDAVTAQRPDAMAEDRLPAVAYAPVWDTLDFTLAAARYRTQPFVN